MQTSLQGIAKKAKPAKRYRFRNLYGMLNEELLRGLLALTPQRRRLRRRSRSVRRTYEQTWTSNIHHLVERLKGKRYRAKLVRRHYIPEGRRQATRPLGIPAVEDKLLQLAVKRLLEAIYEQDFLRCSYGYRPQVGALDAVDTLTVKLQFGRYHYVVEADIKGFFDNIEHEWMMRMLAERIDDQALLRLDQEMAESRRAGHGRQGAAPDDGNPARGHHLTHLGQCVPALCARFVVSRKWSSPVVEAKHV